ncbi:MAG: hypothetical protein ACRDZ5_02870 [Acidimicrobiales bacterium]
MLFASGSWSSRPAPAETSPGGAREAPEMPYRGHAVHEVVHHPRIPAPRIPGSRIPAPRIPGSRIPVLGAG